MCKWIKLPGAWKTEQAYQAIHLLKEYHIRVRTIPDEFSSRNGSKRMLSMDPENLWPLYIKEAHYPQAAAVMIEEHLLNRDRESTGNAVRPRGSASGKIPETEHGKRKRTFRRGAVNTGFRQYRAGFCIDAAEAEGEI